MCVMDFTRRSYEATKFSRSPAVEFESYLVDSRTRSSESRALYIVDRYGAEDRPVRPVCASRLGRARTTRRARGRSPHAGSARRPSRGFAARRRAGPFAPQPATSRRGSVCGARPAPEAPHGRRRSAAALVARTSRTRAWIGRPHCPRCATRSMSAARQCARTSEHRGTSRGRALGQSFTAHESGRCWGARATHRSRHLARSFMLTSCPPWPRHVSATPQLNRWCHPTTRRRLRLAFCTRFHVSTMRPRLRRGLLPLHAFLRGLRGTFSSAITALN